MSVPMPLTFAISNNRSRFKGITAPFAGIITVRNVNVGDLITANSTSFEMSHIQQTDPLRVLSGIPQKEAPNIAVEQETLNVQVG